MTVAIDAHALRKAYHGKLALNGIDLHVDEGRIVGVIGPNGAGKTTALNAIAGLTPYDGNLRVLGREPWHDRDQLLQEVCFIADVAVLPRWIRTSQLIEYVAGVHPGFDRAKADRLLAKTGIARSSKVRELSKGMVTQLHLALAMSIDARLLVLDEPTLGLDPLFRKQFYDTLLSDYFDGNRTIVIATHQLEELQHILTDIVFMDRGSIALACAVDQIEGRYVEVSVHPDRVAGARARHPIHERNVLGRSIFTFDGVDAEELSSLGDTRTPTIPDLYMAVMESRLTTGAGI